MPPIQLQPYSFLGQAWSLWPPHDYRGDLNIVSGVQQICLSILSVCLFRVGEDFIHYEFGLAPDLFQPLSDYEPEYWVYNVEGEIRRWVAGIERLQVQVSGYNNVDNQLRADIQFVPLREPNIHILTFPWYEYQGALINGELSPFLQEIHLNGQPFSPLK